MWHITQSSCKFNPNQMNSHPDPRCPCPNPKLNLYCDETSRNLSYVTAKADSKLLRRSDRNHISQQTALHGGEKTKNTNTHTHTHTRWEQALKTPYPTHGAPPKLNGLLISRARSSNSSIPTRMSTWLQMQSIACSHSSRDHSSVYLHLCTPGYHSFSTCLPPAPLK